LRALSLLRRSAYGEGEKLKAGQLTLDLNDHMASVVGERIILASTNFRLLVHLMKNENKVFSRRPLLDHVWGRDVAIEERTVDVYVLRMPRLLKFYGVHGSLQTAHGIG